MRVRKIPASSTASKVFSVTPLLAQLSGRQKRHVPETLLTLVFSPSFREARAGDACWETTGDDDGDLGESLYILHLQCLAVFYPIYCFVTRTEQ